MNSDLISNPKAYLVLFSFENILKLSVHGNRSFVTIYNIAFVKSACAM
jgi:hypothetical protein